MCLKHKLYLFAGCCVFFKFINYIGASFMQSIWADILSLVIYVPICKSCTYFCSYILHAHTHTWRFPLAFMYLCADIYNTVYLPYTYTYVQRQVRTYIYSNFWLLENLCHILLWFCVLLLFY